MLKDSPVDVGRFKIKTFYLAHRLAKQFMLATECARVLGYEDSDALFRQNSSLFEIILSQEEKDELVNQKILHYSCRFSTEAYRGD